jgi:L-rhamnose-H+ transport protein
LGYRLLADPALDHQRHAVARFLGLLLFFNASTLLPVFLFGAMWGIGNINYGLTMRYLGMSMGIGIAIGITLIVGTLMTPILNGNFDVLIHTRAGR